MNQTENFAQKVKETILNPKNLGEMQGADAVGTVGSADCGDMLRMWLKFKDVDGKRVIDRATFQTFGCETAIAVASLATELITGKTVEEALDMSGQELAGELGPLPPLKIHCAQLVEGALRSALIPEEQQDKTETKKIAPTLIEQFQGGKKQTKTIVLNKNK